MQAGAQGRRGRAAGAARGAPRRDRLGRLGIGAGRLRAARAARLGRGRRLPGAAVRGLAARLQQSGASATAWSLRVLCTPKLAHAAINFLLSGGVRRIAMVQRAICRPPVLVPHSHLTPHHNRAHGAKPAACCLALRRESSTCACCCCCCCATCCSALPARLCVACTETGARANHSTATLQNGSSSSGARTTPPLPPRPL